MERKAVSGIMLTLLLLSMLTLLFNVQPAKASGTIYIEADGSVNPPSAPISSVDNVTYTFTGNINESIVVERDNIVVDGVGYTVQGTGSGTGIDLSYRNNVTLKNVEVTNFNDGIFLYSSSNNTLVGNTASSNNYTGIYLSSSSTNVLTGNTASNNIRSGISLWESGNNVLSGNLASSNNGTGISLLGWRGGSSNDNVLSGNTASSNNGSGISLDDYSYNNVLFHNNLINNTFQADTTRIANTWDNGYPSGGNFWSDYPGVDADGDGIGDTPYVIDVNNQDNYPLIVPVVWNYSNPIPVVWKGVVYQVALSSNSTISTFKFNQPQMQISFNVTGPSGTIGFCNVTIPKSLLSDSLWTITIAGQPPTDFILTSNDTHNFLYFTYTHASTSHVIIQGTSVIPEIPSAIILPLFMVLTILALAFAKRRFPRKIDT